MTPRSAGRGTRGGPGTGQINPARFPCAHRARHGSLMNLEENQAAVCFPLTPADSPLPLFGVR